MSTLLSTIKLLLAMSAQPVDDAKEIEYAVQMAAGNGVTENELLAMALNESKFMVDAEGGLWNIEPEPESESWRMACDLFTDDCIAWQAEKAAQKLRDGIEHCGDLEGALANYSRGRGCRGRNAYVSNVQREIFYVKHLQWYIEKKQAAKTL